MSPVITGNATAAVHNHAHVSIRTRRAATDVDPFEALEAGRARKAIRSPIKPPEGGWTGPEPTLAPEAPPKPKQEARPRTPRPEPKPHKPEPTPEQINELQAQWDRFKALALDGATARQIADSLGLKVERVRRDAKAAGIALTRAEHPGRPIEWDITAATRLAQQGLTAREIAEHVGAATVTVRRVLGRHGVTLVDGRTKYSGGQNSLKRRGDVDPKHVADLYLEHGNATHVASLIGCSTQTVTRILHDEGVTVAPSAHVQKGRPGADRAAPLKTLMREHDTTPVEVRTWGTANGWDVARNGIPSRVVIEAFIAAHTTTTKEKTA